MFPFPHFLPHDFTIHHSTMCVALRIFPEVRRERHVRGTVASRFKSRITENSKKYLVAFVTFSWEALRSSVSLMCS